VELKESHRFRGEGGIGLLASCIKVGDASGALSLLKGGDPEIALLTISRSNANELEDMLARRNEPLWSANGPAAAWKKLAEFRVLCAHRKGFWGVETWNERLSRRARQLQSRSRGNGRVDPILLTQNSGELPLYNGDLGILWQEAEQTRVWFGSGAGELSCYGLSRLPEHEPAYVMSVHKCQGSEVDEAFILLPEVGSPLLTRELLYTAVTRARHRCVVVGTEEAISTAISSSVQRRSGLARAIADATVARRNGAAGLP
jgi:exodeoxyribonuclease V alpha subunit